MSQMHPGCLICGRYWASSWDSETEKKYSLCQEGVKEVKGVEDRKTHYYRCNTIKAIMDALTQRRNAVIENRKEASELKLNNLLKITTAYLAQ